MLRAFAEGKRKALTNSLSTSQLYRSFPESVIVGVNVVGADQASDLDSVHCLLRRAGSKPKSAESMGVRNNGSKKQWEFLRDTNTPPICRYFANTMRHWEVRQQWNDK